MGRPALAVRRIAEDAQPRGGSLQANLKGVAYVHSI
jgi:hypothetical protein